jgi:hypothetical protein
MNLNSFIFLVQLGAWQNAGRQGLMIADVVKLKATHRPYRPTQGLDVAREQILRNKGHP